MKICTSKQALRTQIKHWQSQHKTIAFVPTMGNLHAGHIALVEHAKTLADKIVVSIFVNPTQFDKAEDLQAYPRTMQADQQKLEAVQTDLLFLPSVEVMYPSLTDVCTVQVPASANILEGASRKGHFAGVATVVAKLFNLVQPNIAVFGQKDFQQLMIVRQMVADLDFDIDIVGLPTVRESDGLAMSSRNGYLTKDERAKAPGLFKEINTIRQLIEQGQGDYLNLQNEAMRNLEKQGFVPDYIEIRRQQDLQIPTNDDNELVVLAAAWLGKARLIDNIAFKISHFDSP